MLRIYRLLIAAAIEPGACGRFGSFPQTKIKRPTNVGLFILVGEEGLEPSHPYGYQILSLARLPIPPLAQPLAGRPREVILDL